MSEATETPNYKKTLNLPKTAFPMKANLVQNEPATLKRWAGLPGGGLYGAMREQSQGRERFVFHDGPPYANGSIHLGHLMNKCLKDFVVRSKFMGGLDCPYVPGWDCHGLPIEHRVMTDLVESGKAKKLDGLDDDTRRMAVRRECKTYATKQIKLQAGQMQRLLTVADYEDPYLTMNPRYEGAVLDVLSALCAQGLVYRALKPVHWSVANETALAEAELEYEDREDLSVYVDFEAADGAAVYEAFGLDEAGTTPSFMIWTTTPWTLPANLAIAVHERFTYALVRVDGNVTVIAEDLVEKVTKAGKGEDVEVLATTPGKNLLALRYKHPFVEGAPEGAEDACFKLVHAEYVTLEDGTGLVHTAPGHGTEDYQTGLREGIPTYCPVRADGTYDETVPDDLRGVSIWEANDRIASDLRTSGHLFHMERFTHSYPHDWRSKTPVIFRCTEQWFVGVDRPTTHSNMTLRELATLTVGFNVTKHRGLSDSDTAAFYHDKLDQMAQEQAEAKAVLEEQAGLDSKPLSESQIRDSGAFAGMHLAGSVKFVPGWGRNRMRGMLESRPDWCISRQRAWGLPIPAFVTPEGEAFMTTKSVEAVADVVRAKGSDAWFTESPAVLLASYDAASDSEAPEGVRTGAVSFEQLTKGRDILDVWFESGSSWNAVLRERSGGEDFPSELYLEGSDQHRGWFQLSLLPSLGMMGRPPFKALLTHGFCVGRDGKKLSKSAGHTIEAMFAQHGSDVLRWWVCSLAYENDVKVDEEFFKLAGESYRKIRNTLRFMLSNLSDFEATLDAAGRVELGEIPPTSLEAWVLAEFDRVRTAVLKAYETYGFHEAHKVVYAFCNSTLSAEYLAAVKDRLYCDAVDSARRRRAQRVLWFLTDGLCRLLAPVLCHTADEAWRELRGADAKDASVCVHLTAFPEASGVTVDAEAIKAMRSARSAVLAKLEETKASGLENPLDAGVVVADPSGKLAGFDPADLADLCGVSRFGVGGGEGVAVEDLRGEPRCDRSWKRDGTVRQRSDGGMLSERDAQALGVS